MAPMRKGSDLQMIMIRDCHVVLSVGSRGQSKVASGLTCYLIAEYREAFCELSPRNITWKPGRHIAMTSSRT